MLAQRYQPLCCFSVLALYSHGSMPSLRSIWMWDYSTVVTLILSLLFLATLYLRVTNWTPAEATEF